MIVFGQGLLVTFMAAWIYLLYCMTVFRVEPKLAEPLPLPNDLIDTIVATPYSSDGCFWAFKRMTFYRVAILSPWITVHVSTSP
jgi:hypothetical protein